MADNARLLELALAGLQMEQRRVADEMAEIRKQLGGSSSATKVRAGVKRRGKLSAAGRKALSEAMTRRWANFRKGKGKQPGVK